MFPSVTARPGEEVRISLFNSSIVGKAKYPKYIIRVEFSGAFYQFLTSALMRSSITLQQRSKTGMDLRGQV